MKESKLFKALLAAIVIVALGAPAYATADTSEIKGKSVKVTYSDLNLEKYEGAKALYRRLQQASKQACDIRSYREEGSLRVNAARQQCYETTLSEAVASIDNKLLTQIHSS